MQFELTPMRVPAKPFAVAPVHSESTVQTRIWIKEHEWLHDVYKSAKNASPRFRLPDLLSACVSLALLDEGAQKDLVDLLVARLTAADPRTERRSCDIWAAQFELVLAAHRAPWNRFPNPMFELDHLATSCVALAMARPDGAARVLRQARVNLLDRATARRNAVS